VVTITATGFTITPAAAGGSLLSASWCLKASTQTQNGTGTTGTSTITNKNGVPQAIGYVVVYSVSAGVCWDSMGGPVDLGDILYRGPINTQDNADLMSSTDGTCSGSLRFRGAVVDTTNYTDTCASFYPSGLGVIQFLNGFGYAAAPANFVFCWPA
jgi:hypothetical protein